MLDEAISHAHQTKDVQFVQELVEKNALDFILSGQITTAIRWLDFIPNEVVITSSRLCLDRAWALTFISQTETSKVYLDRAEFLVKSREAVDVSKATEILGLQSSRSVSMGNLLKVCTWLGLAGLALLEADFLQYATLSLNHRGETEQAVHLLEETIQIYERASTGNRKAANLYLYVGLGRIFYTSNQLEKAESAIKNGLGLIHSLAPLRLLMVG